MTSKYFSGPRSMCLHTALMLIVSALWYLDTGNWNWTQFSCTIASVEIDVKRKHITCNVASGIPLEIKGKLSGRWLQKEIPTGLRSNLKPCLVIQFMSKLKPQNPIYMKKLKLFLVIQCMEIAGVLSHELRNGYQPWGYSCSKVWQHRW